MDSLDLALKLAKVALVFIENEYKTLTLQDARLDIVYQVKKDTERYIDELEHTQSLERNGYI